MAENEGTVLSRAAYERLKAELEQLQGPARRDVADRLRKARELGDISENAEFHATKEEQALMESRIRTLEHLIRNAEVAEGPVASDQAVVGTIVTLRPTESADAEPERYLLASSSEEDSESAATVTVQSPLGRAIMGAHVGDVVKYQAPGGVFAYEVISIDPWDGSG